MGETKQTARLSELRPLVRGTKKFDSNERYDEFFFFFSCYDVIWWTRWPDMTVRLPGAQCHGQAEPSDFTLFLRDSRLKAHEKEK